MMLIAASCPSNSAAAVTNRTGCAGTCSVGCFASARSACPCSAPTRLASLRCATAVTDTPSAFPLTLPGYPGVDTFNVKYLDVKC